ncbi:MAG: hypothetical protein ABID87_00280 [Chloroflexota bacterium]
MRNESDNHAETHQERRERKLRKKKEQIQKHGKNLAQLYYDAVMKRLKRNS